MMTSCFTRGSLLATLLLFFTFPMFAGSNLFFSDGIDPRFERIDRTDGLSNLSVSAILQDRDGFMWFGTQGGLNRYDGNSFHVYRHQPFQPDGLPHNLIQTMLYDAEREAIWIGTYRGLSHFDKASGHFQNFAHSDGSNSSLSNNLVIALEQEKDGTLWVGTAAGLNRLLPGSDVFDHFSVPGNVVRALHIDAAGTLWVGSYGGLQRFERETDSLVSADVSLPTPYVMTINEPHPGTLLLGCWDGGLVTYTVETGTTTLSTFADNRVYTVAQTGEGTTWVGTWGGGLFAVLPDGSLRHYGTTQTNDGLSHNVVYALYTDHAGNLWIGTNGGGINFAAPQIRDFRILHHEPGNPDSLSGGKVNVMLRDSTGDLWIGVYSGGLNRVRRETGEIIHYRHDSSDRTSLADDTVNAIFEDTRGVLWIGSHGGLQKFVRSRNSFLTWGNDINSEAPLPDNIVYTLAEDDRHRLWIGTYNGGVLRYDPQTGHTVGFQHEPGNQHSLSDNLIYDILATRSGDVWIATNNGLNRYLSDERGFQQYHHRPDDLDSLSGSTVRTLYEDSRGSLWVGTSSGGVNRFHAEDGTFSHFTEQEGLSDNVVVGIMENGRGWLWIATHGGLTAYDPATGMIQTLREDDGLYGTEFSMGHYQEADGSMLFATSQGVMKIPGDYLLQDRAVPPIHITDISIFDTALSPDRVSFNGATVSLEPNQRAITIGFVALDYASRKHLSYLYRLDGFDETWRSSGERNHVTYTNLPPGGYTFHVKDQIALGSQTAAPAATFTLNVAAPWWRTGPAVVLYVLLATALLVMIMRMRETALVKSQNVELERANTLLESANQELKKLTVDDPLTCVYNRRYFDSHLKEEIERARRYGGTVALLLIDIDHFKRFNDEYGHLAGDRCLSQVAEILKGGSARSGDFVARYGGEEFAVFLMGTDRAGAEVIALELTQRIMQLTPVTVSIGLAAGLPGDGATPRSYIEAADRALYRAKADGRNIVRTADL